MTIRTMNAALKIGRSHRTGQPVHRRSKQKGKCEQGFWQPTDKKKAWKIVTLAERFDEIRKEKGAKSGPLGLIAIKLLRYLVNRLNKATGQLDPSYETMMEKLRVSRDSIWRALDALRRHGFLDWLRRYVPTNSPEGPQVKQTSNAYRLLWPVKAAQIVAAVDAPIPADAATHELEKQISDVEYQAQEWGGWQVIQNIAIATSPQGQIARSLLELREKLRKHRGSDMLTEPDLNSI